MGSTLSRVVGGLSRRLALIVNRVAVRLVNDALRLQNVQIDVLNDETLDNVVRMQEYGFTSNPQPGAEGIALSPSGRRSNTVVICVDDRRYRLRNLASGEVALYTDEGDSIWLRRGRNIEVNAGSKVKVTAPNVEVVASAKVTLTTPLVEVTGNLAVDGNATVQGTVLSNTSIADPSGTMQEMRGFYNSHTHPGGGAPNPQMT